MAERGDVRIGWVAVPVVLVVLLGAGLGVLNATVDRTWTTTLRPGTVIEDVPVGGLTADAAVSRLRERLEQPLHRPIKVSAEQFEAQTSPWELGLRIDVEAIVDQAMDESRSGNLLTRAWSRVVSSGQTHVAAAPSTWSGRARRFSTGWPCGTRVCGWPPTPPNPRTTPPCPR